MSVLSSSKSGKLYEIEKYIDEKFNNRIEYKIKTYLTDYKIVANVKLFGSLLEIDGETLPCRIEVRNKPFLIFKNFKKKSDFEKIEKSFYNDCFNYEFRHCTFEDDCIKWLVYNYRKIVDSVFILSEKSYNEIWEKYHIRLEGFLDYVKTNRNCLFIKEDDKIKEITKEQIDKILDKNKYNNYTF